MYSDLLPPSDINFYQGVILIILYQGMVLVSSHSVTRVHFSVCPTEHGTCSPYKIFGDQYTCIWTNCTSVVNSFQFFFENPLHASEPKLCSDLFAAIKK